MRLHHLGMTVSEAWALVSIAVVLFALSVASIMEQKEDSHAD